MSVYNNITRLETETNRVNFERGRNNLGNDKLDKQAFLQLLMAKLKMQDPLEPVKDNEFMTQQAQLAQVEKLDDLLSVLKGNSLLGQASSLVGKRVEVTGAEGSMTTGVVENVSFSNGDAGLFINGQTYKLNQISKIYSN